MKIQLGQLKIQIAAWIAILALGFVIALAIWCAAAHFQSLELHGSFLLTAKPS